MEDVTLSWPGSMTTEQAKKYLLTAGFVPVELYRQQIAQSDTRRKSIMDKKQQTTSAGPDFVTKLPQVDERGDETPMQSDQIVTLARAVRLLAFHVENMTMQDQEFRRNCELRAMDEPVSNRQALEALDHIVKNPQRDAEDTRTLNQAVSALENFIYIHQDRSKIDESCRPTVEQLQEEQSALVEDLVHKANLLRIAEKALEDIRGLCISSTYWNNPEYPNCARLLKQHHKIVGDAQVKAAEMRAIEYGDDVEVPIGERS